MVDLDAELLTLVWNKLFSYAIKFTEAEGMVTLSLKSEGEDAVVQVTDTGCGIQPEVGAHIFENSTRVIRRTLHRETGWAWRW